MPRTGFLTASTFPELMKEGKAGPFSKTAMRHIYRLALDMLDVERPDDVSSESLEWGRQNEECAKYDYEFKTMQQVRKARFKASRTLPYVGGTADGLIGQDGGVEFKCPKDSTIHLFNRDEHFKQYEWQLHGYIWIYRLNWLDFVSYDPRCKEHLQLIIRRVDRDEAKIRQLEARCIEAHTLAREFVQQVKVAYGPEPETVIPF